MLYINSYYFTVAGNQYQFSRMIDTAGADQGLSVTTDKNGNMYISGFYTGTPTIKDEAGVTIFTLPATVGAGTTGFVSRFSNVGTYQYSFIFEGTNTTEQSFGVTCDGSSGLYVTGLFAAALTISDHFGTSLGTVTASSGNAGFISKFNNGFYIWTRVIDSTGADQSLGVACDPGSNVYMSGYYTGTPTIKFENGTGSNTLPASTLSAGFISKFNTNGVYQWSRVIDSAGADQSQGVACDSLNNVYMVGYYAGTPTIKFENGTGSNTLPASSGGTNAGFISKFSTTGVYQWSRVIDSAGDDRSLGVACDSLNNVYMVGYYTGTPTIKFENGNGSNTLPASNTSSNAGFISKFDTNGVYQYSRIIDASGVDQSLGVACDSINNVYMAGFYTGTPTIKFENGNGSNTLPASTLSAGFISKFDTSGVYQWSRVIDSAGADQTLGVACDSRSNVYITGYYNGNPTIITQSGIELGTLPSTTTNAGFVCQFDTSGNYLTNSASHVYSRIAIATTIQFIATQGVACDSGSNVYIVGYYNGILTLQSQRGITLATLPASNASNAGFLSKFDPTGVHQWSRVIDSGGEDRALGVACDPGSNVFVVGYYTGTPIIKFENGTGSNTMPASSGIAGFISKFDTTGVYQWSRVIDSAGDDRVLAVACDAGSNVYMTGFYTGTPTIKFENGNGSNTLPASTLSAGFISKFSTTGVYQWSRAIDSAGADQSLGVICDPGSNVYMSGYYAGTPTIRFENGTGSNTLPASSAGSNAGFISKFNTSGVYQWSRVIDSAADDRVLAVACDAGSNVYMCGQYNGTPTIKFENGTGSNTLPASSGGSVTAFYSKFNTTGDYQYSRIVDATGTDATYSCFIDNIGNVFMSGVYAGTGANMKDQAGNILGIIPASVSSTNAAYMCKFDVNGTYILNRTLDSTTADQALQVVSDSVGNIYMAGYYTGTPSIYTEAGNIIYTLPAANSQSGFLTKFSPFLSNTAIYEYPPTRLTANTFIVGGQPYGNGTYIVSATSESAAANGPFAAFEKTASNVYSTALSRYSATSPFPSTSGLNYDIYFPGEVFPLTVSGDSITITLPSAIQLVGYSIQVSTNASTCPATFYMVGYDESLFGYVLLDERRGYTTWLANRTSMFQILPSGSYKIFTFICTHLNSTTTQLQIAELRLFSSTYSVLPGFVIYINASTIASGGSIPSPTVNNTAITSWGPFTGQNSPLYFSSGGPNNKPYVNFKGGAGSGNQGNWMTCSVACNGNTGGGMTLFAYVLNTIGSTQARFFLASGGVVSFMGGGTAKFSFENNLTFDNTLATYSDTGQWITVCFRSTMTGSSVTKEIFINGVLTSTYTETASTANDTFIKFARSEFDDLENDPYWQGRLYSLLLYPRALSNTEIQTLDTRFRNGVL